MPARARRLFTASVTALLLAMALGVPVAAAPADDDRALDRLTRHRDRASCATDTRVGFAHCHARVRTDVSVTTAPSGYGPSDPWAAYHLGSATIDPGGATIAIVDAYDDPNAEADLNTYRAQFGLSNCTSASGCFTKADEFGGTSFPSSDIGWSEEISLDLDMASAICPKCRILLVEASSANFADLATAVDYAASAPTVVAISNSYGGGEWSGETWWESHWNHRGIAVTASSGDSGYGVEFPAASQFVTAVGGTTLARASNSRGWAERAWGGAGAGCSAYEPKPSWQNDRGCTRRTVADVSAIADPNTGVAVYDSYGQPGWMVFGGTSVAAPIIASVYALAQNTTALTYASFAYSHRGNLFDVTTGSDGSCRTAYLCKAGPGYDGPTGLGTPNGTGAF